MTVENILLSISTKVWDLAGIELMTPGSAISLATYCATGPSRVCPVCLSLFGKQLVLEIHEHLPYICTYINFLYKYEFIGPFKETF